MTPEERAVKCCPDDDSQFHPKTCGICQPIAAAILAAVAEEREACAKIADDWGRGEQTIAGEGIARRGIASAIRARARAVAAPSLAFGGRCAGQSCGCGGTLETTRHEGVASRGTTLDCNQCPAGYDEEGRHYCPKCEQYMDGWVGGTDADPRPECPKCMTTQPGWSSTKKAEGKEGQRL